MNWYTWDSIGSFNTWHEAIKTQLGLPKTSVTADGTQVLDAVITNQYTNPFTVAKDDIRAMVEPDYADGLTPSESPYIDERQAL